MPYPYLMNLVSNYLEKQYSIQYSKNQWHLIKNVVEITDHSFWATLYISSSHTRHAAMLDRWALILNVMSASDLV